LPEYIDVMNIDFTLLHYVFEDLATSQSHLRSITVSCPVQLTSSVQPSRKCCKCDTVLIIVRLHLGGFFLHLILFLNSFENWTKKVHQSHLVYCRVKKFSHFKLVSLVMICFCFEYLLNIHVRVTKLPKHFLLSFLCSQVNAAINIEAPVLNALE
jgi:hypothetical protein